MFLIPWLLWIALWILVLHQIARGAVINGRWQPWFYCDTQPKRFRAVIIVQCLMLTLVGAGCLQILL